MKRVHHNSVTGVDPLKVALLYATSNLRTEYDLDYAKRVSDLIRDRRFGEAKVLLDDYTRPEFTDGFSYYCRKQFSAFLSKVPFEGDHRARQQRAEDAFWASEARCKRSNRRLRHFYKYVNRLPDDLRVVMSRAREEVRKIFGKLTEERLDDLIRLAYPGRGVSIGTRNSFRVSLPYKLGDTDLACTPSALPYARRWVESSTAWLRLHVEVDWKTLTYDVPYATAESNRITFVPKDSRTLRTIAIEPSLNVGLQLGVHKYLAGRLKQFGNPIDDQTRNQGLAHVGSLTPLGVSYATIDLSQASDSVSTELVRWLLPPEWFGYLDDLRCKTGSLRDSIFTYEKFSSMGNGFTFALETVIFLSLARACISLTRGRVASVYGDDIVIDDDAALLLTEVLRFCGFSVNSEKSFYFGPFRESCGADWHYGSRVTPQYIRRPKLRTTDIYNLLNRLDPCFDTKSIRRYCIEEIRRLEPVVYGCENEDTSSCLFVPLSSLQRLRLANWSSSWKTYTFKGWVFRPELERVPPLTGLAASLFGSSEDGNRGPLRGRGTFRLRTLTPGVTRGLPRWGAGT